MTYIYYITCILSVFLIYLAQKFNKKSFLFLTILFLSCLVGFRGIDVGIDTKVYHQQIDYIREGIFKSSEFGYIFFVKLLLLINNSNYFVIFVFSSITYFLILFRYWQFRDRVNLSLLLFIFLSFNLQLSMNIMRQYFAIAIIFFATQFLERKKYLTYLFCVCIAFSFHRTSVLGILLLFIYLFINEKNKYKRLKIMSFSIIFSVTFLVIFKDKLLNYLDYLAVTNIDFGLLIPLKIFFLMYICIFNKKKINNTIGKELLIIYLIGLMFTMLGYMFPFLERLGLLFMLYEPIFLSYVSSKKHNNQYLFNINTVYTICLCLFIVVTSFISNGNGVFPYINIF